MDVADAARFMILFGIRKRMTLQSRVDAILSMISLEPLAGKYRELITNFKFGHCSGSWIWIWTTSLHSATSYGSSESVNRRVIVVGLVIKLQGDNIVKP